MATRKSNIFGLAANFEKRDDAAPVSPTRASVLGQEAELKKQREAVVAERLEAYMEDLADWIAGIFKDDTNSSNMTARFETGVRLCQIAQIIERGESDPSKRVGKFAALHAGAKRQPVKAPTAINQNAKPGDFFSRDNVTAFINWCKGMGVDRSVLFEADDLVLGKNVKNFYYSLMEMSRVQGGVEPPLLVQLERNIDSGKIHSRTPEEEANLIAEIRKILKEIGWDVNTPIVKGADGKYTIGSIGPLALAQLRNHIMVRLTGTWDTLKHYLLSNEAKNKPTPSTPTPAPAPVPEPTPEPKEVPKEPTMSRGAIDNELATLRRLLEEARREIFYLEDDKKKKDARIKELEKAIWDLEHSSGLSQSTLSELQAEVDRLKKRAKEAEESEVASRVKAEGEVAALRARIDADKQGKAGEAEIMKDLSEKIAKLENENRLRKGNEESLREKLLDTERRLKKAEETAEALDRDLEEMDKSQSQLDTDNRKKLLDAELKNQQLRDELKTEKSACEGLRKREADLDAQLSKLKKQNEDLETQKANDQGKIKGLSAELEGLKGQLKNTHSLNETRGAQIPELQAKILSLTAEIEALREQNRLSDSQAKAKVVELEFELKRKGEDLANFEARCKLHSTKDQAEIESQKNQIAMLTGQINDLEKKNRNVLLQADEDKRTSDHQISDLQADLQATTSKLKNAETKVKELKAELEELESHKESTGRNTGDLQRKYDLLLIRIKEAEEERDTEAQRGREYLVKIRELELKLKEAFEDAAKQNQNSEIARMNLEKEFKKATDRANTLQIELDASRTDASKYRRGSEEDTAKLRRDYETKLLEQRVDLEQKAKDAQNQLQTKLGARIEELERILSESKEDSSFQRKRDESLRIAAETQVKDLTLQVQQLQNSLDSAKAAQRQWDQELERQISEAVEKALTTERNSSLGDNKRIQQLQEELAAMETKAAEQRAKDAAERLAYKRQVEDNSADEIRNLRDEIRRLGKLTEDQKKRYEKQISDIEAEFNATVQDLQAKYKNLQNARRNLDDEASVDEFESLPYELYEKLMDDDDVRVAHVQRLDIRVDLAQADRAYQDAEIEYKSLPEDGPRDSTKLVSAQSNRDLASFKAKEAEIRLKEAVKRAIGKRRQQVKSDSEALEALRAQFLDLQRQNLEIDDDRSKLRRVRDDATIKIAALEKEIARLKEDMLNRGENEKAALARMQAELDDLASIPRDESIGDSLRAYRADITDWINDILAKDILEETLIQDLADGKILCEIALALDSAILVSDLDTPEMNRLKASRVTFPAEKFVDYETKSAKERVDMFIEFCRTIGLADPDVFDARDILDNRSEQRVIFGLFDVARQSTSLGIPRLVWWERNRPIEMQRPDKDDELHLAVCAVLSEVDGAIPLRKVSKGRYLIGKEQKLLLIRAVNDRVMIRVGGGWEDLKAFLKKYQLHQRSLNTGGDERISTSSARFTSSSSSRNSVTVQRMVRVVRSTPK